MQDKAECAHSCALETARGQQRILNAPHLTPVPCESNLVVSILEKMEAPWNPEQAGPDRHGPEKDEGAGVGRLEDENAWALHCTLLSDTMRYTLYPRLVELGTIVFRVYPFVQQAVRLGLQDFFHACRPH